MVVQVFVLGIDPGLSRCGYAVLDARSKPARAIAIGVLRTAPADPLPARLAEIHAELKSLLDEFGPSVVAIERIFFQHNVRTAVSVGQVSGLIIAEAAARGCEVALYSPNEVKLAVAGDGAADKVAVAAMVTTLLKLSRTPDPPDAADAAALALCHLAHAPLAAAIGATS